MPPPPPANSAAPQPSAHSKTNTSAVPSSATARAPKNGAGQHRRGELHPQRKESALVVGVDKQHGGVGEDKQDGHGVFAPHYMDVRPPVFTRGDVATLSNANAIAGPCPRSPRRKAKKNVKNQGGDVLSLLQVTVDDLSRPRASRDDTPALPVASQDLRAVETYEFFSGSGAKGMLKEQGWVIVDGKSRKKQAPQPVPPRTGPFRPATIPAPGRAPPPQPDPPPAPAQPRSRVSRPFAKRIFVPDEDGVSCYYRILDWDLAHCPPSQLALLTSLRCEEMLHYDEEEQRDMERVWDEQGDSTIYGIAEYHDPAPVEGGEEAAEQELVEYRWNGQWYEGKQEGGGGGLGGAGGGVGGLGPGGGGGGPGGGGGNGGGGGGGHGGGGGGGHGGGGAGAGGYDGGDEEDDDEEVEGEVKAPPRPPSPQQPRLGNAVHHHRRTSWAEGDVEDNNGKIPPKSKPSAAQPPRSTTSTTSSPTPATTSTATTPSAAKPSQPNISASTGQRTFGGQTVPRQYGRKNAAQRQVAAHKAADEATGLGQHEQGSGVEKRERDKKGKDVQPETLVLSSGSSSSEDDGDFEVVSFLPAEPVQTLSQTRKPRPSPASTRSRKGACNIFSHYGQVKREEDEDEEHKPLLTREQVRRDPYGHLEASSSGTEFSQLSPSYTNDGLPVGEASSPCSMSDPEPISGWTATFPSLHKMNPLKDPDDEPWAGPVGLYSKEAIDRVRSFGTDYYLLFQLNELIRAADGHSLFIRSRNSLYLFDRDLRKAEAALLTKTYGEGQEPPSLFPPNRSLSSSFDRLNDLIEGLAKKARFGEGTSSFGTDIAAVVKSRRAAAAAAFAKKSSKRRPRGSLSTAALGTLGYGKGPVNVDLRRVIRPGGKRKRRAVRHYLKRPEAWLDEDELPP